MKCYFCDKHLVDGESKDFVCICDNCLKVVEKSEARMVKKVYELTKKIEMILELMEEPNEPR